MDFLNFFLIIFFNNRNSMEYSKIEMLKEKRKFSNDEMGKIIGISGVGYKKMVETRSCRVDYLEKFSEYFKKPITWFFEPFSNESLDPASPYNIKCNNPKCTEEKEDLQKQIRSLTYTNETLAKILNRKTKEEISPGEPEGGVEMPGKTG